MKHLVVSVSFFFVVLIAACATPEEDAFCSFDEDCGDTTIYFCDQQTGECREKAGTTDTDDIAGGDEEKNENDISDIPDGDLIEATDLSDGSDGADDIIVPDNDTPTQWLDPVTGLTIDIEIDQLTLAWQNPTMAGLTDIKVVRSMIAFPQNIFDGDLLYEGLDQTYADTSVDSGKSHFYSVFACYGELGCSEPAVMGGIPCYDRMDLVFVMDVSTSMGYILSDLENEIGEVWDQVSQKVETTPRMGLTVFVDDVTVVNDGSTPYATVEQIKGDFHSWYQHTSSNEQTQSTEGNYDWPENSLDGLALTAKNFQWRDPAKALRIIILATDDTFREKPASFSSGIAAQHTYDETVTLLKEGRIRVAAFAAKIGGSTGTTDVQPGFFTPYNGKEPIPAATGGTVFFIDDVKSGTLSLVDAITGFVETERCVAGER